MAKAVISAGLLPPLITLGIIRLTEAIFLIAATVLWGQGLISIGLAGDQLLSGIKRGLLWSFAFGAAVSCVFGILYAGGINPLSFFRMRVPERPLEIIYLYVAGGLLSPIAEEIFFRGILYGFLRRWGVMTAIFLSTLLFVLPHLADTSLPVAQFVGGMVFAVSYEVEGKLTVPITIHVLGNLSIMTLSVLF